MSFRSTRRGFGRAAIHVVTSLTLIGAASAQQPGEEQPPEEQPPEEQPPEEQPPAVPDLALPGDGVDQRLRELEEQNEDLRDELELLQEDLKYLEERHEAVAPVTGKVTGYLDFGFFSVTGDGRGIRSDIGYVHFPEYRDVGIPSGWVFYGDPLSTAVNARGDPANVHESRAITFDGIGSGSSSFIVNSLNLGLFAAVGDNAVFTGKVDFVPRGRDMTDPDGLFFGDFVDVRLAYFEYRVPREWVNLSLFAGKFDSVVGFEYRSQEAPSRIEVTPSLVCRYVCGSPLGLKARAQFFSDSVVLNVGVTNGSHFTEGFGFHDEIDRNHFKTVAGRLSYVLPVGGELEVGLSGVFGAQDGQPQNDVYQWMIGADAHYHRHDLVLRAEFVHGRAEGDADEGRPVCELAPCLDFKAAYGLAGYRVTAALMPFVRVDWRDALHQEGASFVYISQLWRATAGARLDVSPNVIVKAEYTVNRSLGRAPQFPSDVFTSALVVRY